MSKETAEPPHDTVLTPERITALEAVDLRLVGVRHGITRDEGLPRVARIDDQDYGDLQTTVSRDIDSSFGDVLAVEPTEFFNKLVEQPRLSDVLPPEISETPIGELPFNEHYLARKGTRSPFHQQLGIYGCTYATPWHHRTNGRNKQARMGNAQGNASKFGAIARDKGAHQKLLPAQHNVSAYW